MKDLYSLESNNRRTGRTTKMIKLVVRCIIEGQPLCRVVGNSGKTISRELIPMLIKELENKGLEYERPRECIITSMKTEITFHNEETIERFMMGREMYDCQFWDHATINKDRRENRYTNYEGGEIEKNNNNTYES